MALSAGILLLLSGGCSKDNTPAAYSGTGHGTGWETDPSLPVPIQFSSFGMDESTRAVSPGMIEGTSMANLDIGIFALAVTDDHEPDPSGDPDNNKFNLHQYPQTWSTDDAGSILLSNEKVTTGDFGQIEMADKFYPLDDLHQYSFYSYYPFSENISLHRGTEGEYYTAEFGLGSTDILYACDDAFRFKYFPDRKGFNGGYIRFLKQNEEKHQYYSLYKPRLVFRHLLAALKVNASSAVEDTDVRISKVELTDAYMSAVLYIADSRKTDNMSGRLEPSDKGRLTLTDGGKTDFSDVPIGAESVELSEFLVFAGDEDHPVHEFTMEVTFGRYIDGHLSGNPVTRTSILRPPEGSFEAGKMYSVEITVEDSLNMEGIDTSVNEFTEGDNAGSVLGQP